MGKKARRWRLGILLLAALAGGGCGPSFLSNVPSGGGGSGKAGFAYVTNFDGNVSEFTVNTSGSLNLIGMVTAGAANGPVGLAATSNYLYVANFADSLIHEFKITRSSGALKTIGSTTTGTGGGPNGIAVTPSGNFAYVTNRTSGTLVEFAISSSNGALSSIGEQLGLRAPEGIAANSSHVFVADSTAGVIDAFTIGSNGVLTFINQAAISGSIAGNPSQVAIAPSGSLVYATDSANGLVSLFTVASNGALTFQNSFSVGASNDQPTGIAVSPSGGFLYSANTAAGSITEFQINTSIGTLTAIGSATGLNRPTGLGFISSGGFLYSANRGDGTVSQFSVQTNGLLSPVNTVSTENPANSASGPRFIVLVQ